ncbi:MAG: PIN domain-containing protein [Mariprofundaceae bacterium]|nr:PIN domain-containing protein [Mariprofundaceae bacterium]
MLTVRLDEATEQKLHAIMQAQDRSRSAIIKQLIHQYQANDQAEATTIAKPETSPTRQRHLLSSPNDLSQQNRQHAFGQSLMIQDALIDAASIIAFYHQNNPRHAAVYRYVEAFQGKLITSLCCIAEVMWVLKEDSRVQLELFADLNNELFHCPSLQSQDYQNMQQLFIKQQYQQSFTDLSLIALSQQLNIGKILCSSQDFSRYQQMNTQLYCITVL